MATRPLAGIKGDTMTAPERAGPTATGPIERVAEASISLGLRISQISIVCMMALITTDVIARNFFRKSLLISDEVSGYLLVITTFSALGYALLNDDHIQVTLLTDRLSAHTRRYLAALWCLVGLPFVALLVWRTAVLALDSFRSGSFSVASTNMILWPIQIFAPLGLAILFMQMLALLSETIDRILRGAP